MSGPGTHQDPPSGARKRASATLFSLLPPRPKPRDVADEGWMDGHMYGEYWTRTGFQNCAMSQFILVVPALKRFRFPVSTEKTYTVEQLVLKQPPSVTLHSEAQTCNCKNKKKSAFLTGGRLKIKSFGRLVLSSGGAL